MYQLHLAGKDYGQPPGEMMGLTRGTWQCLMVTIAAQIRGEEAKAAMAARIGMVFPTAEVR